MRLFEGFLNWLKEDETQIRESEDTASENTEEDKKKEMIDVEVDGRYSFKVVERPSTIYDWMSIFSIDFEYEANGTFMDESINSKGYFSIIPTSFNDEYLMRGTNYLSKDVEMYAYKYLAELIEDGEEIMDNLKNCVLKDIKEHLNNKNIEKLKKTIGENNSFDINLSFQIEKDKRFKL
jgi:hypothetical protein